MVAFQQIVDHGVGSACRVFVRDQLGKFRRRVENHASVLFERDKRPAASGCLVDMPCHRDAAVRRLVILPELALAGHADGTDLDRTSIGIEPLELLFGGQQADLIEGILDRLFGFKHGTSQWQGNLDGD